MADRPGGSRTLLLIVALVAVLALAWWLTMRGSGAEEEPVYEAGATDVSGGELIVTDPEETGVPVDLPETEMTNVPPGEEPTPAVPPPPAE